MADTPKRFIGPMGMPNNFTTLYTVPAGATVILRYMKVNNTNASSDYQFVLSLGPDAVGSRLFDQLVPAGGVYEWAGFIPMQAAETLVGTGTQANVLTMLVTGVEVT